MAKHSLDTSPGGKNADDGDWLGYGAYADALWSRIQTALIKSEGSDAKLGDDPLVIGVFGEWGAGKSKLLSLMQDRSRSWANERIGWRERDSGNFGLTVPVYFQPWKYEHEAHLHVPILLHILAALKEELESAQTWFERAGGKVPPWVSEHMTKVVSAFGMVLAGAAWAMDAAVPPAGRAGVASAGFLASLLPKAKKAGDAELPNPAETLKFEDSGRYFYEIHQILKAITRPKQHGHLLQGVNLNADLPINFVIFIDDLDRCLPEKAVQTLELIKTIFNAESFAFVLALDDEVIERGIGHRYKDYELLNKKPSMPITGFEYLEKIVHLPFKLPALTRGQASAFVQKLEAQIAGDAVAKHWFRPIDDQNPQARFRRTDAIPGKEGADAFSMANPRGAASFELEKFDLMALALAGFDAYVPRKLSRMVELWHMTVEIAKKRHAADARKGLLAPSTAAQVDIRIVLALQMVQIFHPDLYRVLRRHEETFKTLFEGFSIEPNKLTANYSDIDLWHWAAYRFTGAAPAPAAAKPPTTVDEALALIAQLDIHQRFAAQQKRLPLVECLIAHRKVQRHVFDSLKLIEQLQRDLPELPAGFQVAQYFSLLAQFDENLFPVRVPAMAPVAAASAEDLPRFVPRNQDQLFRSLIADDSAMQDALVETNALEVGKYLTADSVVALVASLQAWLGRSTESDKATRLRETLLLKGLRHLAPFLATDDKKSLWRLVQDAVHIEKPTDPKLRALWGDVRSLLSCDDRFNPEKPCLFNSRFDGHTAQDEPIPGFVHIPAGQFPMGSEEDKDNPPRQVAINHPFYISRTLVTVQQYARFIKAGAYKGDNPWWDKQGVEWRNGKFDSKVKDERYKKWLAQRRVDLRQQPMGWPEQENLASRPVSGVSWFEARAYARWLNAEMRQSITDATIDRAYEIRLPTETQWERAARAKSLTEADTRRWPWGDDEKLADQRANLNQKVGIVSAVGLYPPNPIGLYDMAGNAWEWMDNLYQSKPDKMLGVRKDVDLMSAEALEKSDLPALRGGSWFLGPGGARCSCRNRGRPDAWAGYVGFRVVLSLAD